MPKLNIHLYPFCALSERNVPFKIKNTSQPHNPIPTEGSNFSCQKGGKKTAEK
jgi:hypothetical protein